jgi:CRP-like cAMP-binding protein
VTIQKKLGESQQELARLGPGECFGEMALFDDSPRAAMAVAASDCALLTLDRSRFHSVLAQRPEMALEICRVLSVRLRDANERLGRAAQA